jgi:hypothetical protein
LNDWFVEFEVGEIEFSNMVILYTLLKITSSFGKGSQVVMHILRKIGQGDRLVKRKAIRLTTFFIEKFVKNRKIIKNRKISWTLWFFAVYFYQKQHTCRNLTL